LARATNRTDPGHGQEGGRPGRRDGGIHLQRREGLDLLSAGLPHLNHVGRVLDCRTANAYARVVDKGPIEVGILDVDPEVVAPCEVCGGDGGNL